MTSIAINDDYKQVSDTLPGPLQPTIINIRECCGCYLKTCLDHLTNHHLQGKFLIWKEHIHYKGQQINLEQSVDINS